MYCKICGKQIDYDSPVCNECKEKQQAVTPEAQTQATSGFAFRPIQACENPYENAQSTVGTCASPIKEATAAVIEIPKTEEPEENSEKKEMPAGNRMHGFGPALAGVILGLVASIIDSVTGYVSGVSSFLTLLADLSGNADMGNNITASGMVVNILIGIVCLAIGIVTLCLGAKSVKAFKAHKNETGTKAIATLILGIAGIVIGACGIIGFIDNIVTLFVYLGMGLLGSAMG